MDTYTCSFLFIFCHLLIPLFFPSSLPFICSSFHSSFLQFTLSFPYLYSIFFFTPSAILLFIPLFLSLSLLPFIFCLSSSPFSIHLSFHPCCIFHFSSFLSHSIFSINTFRILFYSPIILSSPTSKPPSSLPPPPLFSSSCLLLFHTPSTSFSAPLLHLTLNLHHLFLPPPFFSSLPLLLSFTPIHILLFSSPFIYL